MNKNTFSILFFIQKGKANKEGKAPIMARITINGRMTHISTRLSVDPERWLPKECRTLGTTKNDKQINKYLEEYKSLVHAKYNELLFAGEVLTSDALKHVLSSKDKKSISLLELFDEFLDEYSKLVGHSITKRTYDKYILARKRLESYIHLIYFLIVFSNTKKPTLNLQNELDYIIEYFYNPLLNNSKIN